MQHHFHNRHRNIDEEKNPSFEKFHHQKLARTEKPENREKKRGQESRFRCGNCGSLVSADRELAGVNNRNHCPSCLWSKHVDEYKAGDRKATCGARMQPIGLTVKKRHKKYAASTPGELMLIHRCTGCGKISINRIASDDSTGALIALYRLAQELSPEQMLELAAQGIHLLSAADVTTVFSQLFGWQAILEEFQAESAALAEPVELDEDTLKN